MSRKSIIVLVDPFLNMAEFSYLGSTVASQNLVQEEIQRDQMIATIQSRTFCLLVCSLQNLKMRIFDTIMFHV
jgi:hypothetical protein